MNSIIPSDNDQFSNCKDVQAVGILISAATFDTVFRTKMTISTYLVTYRSYDMAGMSIVQESNKTAEN